MHFGFNEFDFDDDDDENIDKNTTTPLHDEGWSVKTCERNWFFTECSQDEAEAMRVIKHCGDRLYHTQQHEEALEKFTQLLDVLPESRFHVVRREVQESVVRTLLKLDRADDALVFFNKTKHQHQTAEQKTITLLLLRQIYKQLRNVKEELFVTQLLVNFNPASYQLWLELADVYKKLNMERCSNVQCTDHMCFTESSIPTVNGIDVKDLEINNGRNENSSQPIYCETEQNFDSVEQDKKHSSTCIELGRQVSGQHSGQEIENNPNSFISQSTCSDTVPEANIQDRKQLTTCACNLQDTLVKNDTKNFKESSVSLLLSDTGSLSNSIKPVVQSLLMENGDDISHSPELICSDSGTCSQGNKQFNLQCCTTCKVITCLVCAKLCFKNCYLQTKSFVREQAINIGRKVDDELRGWKVQKDLENIITEYLKRNLFNFDSSGAVLMIDDEDFVGNFEKLLCSWRNAENIS